MEEMEVNYVDDIHEKLTDMVGDRVKVKANMGRTRGVERMGTIKSVHPAVFIVEVDDAAASRVSPTSTSTSLPVRLNCSTPRAASTSLLRSATSSRSINGDRSVPHPYCAGKD